MGGAINMDAFNVDAGESPVVEDNSNVSFFDEVDDESGITIENSISEDEGLNEDNVVEEVAEESPSKEEPAAEEPKEEVQEEESPSPEGNEDAEVEKANDIKKLEGKLGEDAYEVAADAVFKHKIDGEEVDVSMQELLNNYSGKVAYDKKFQELGTEKAEFAKSKETIEKYVDSFSEKMHNGDVMGAMEYIASFANIKPLDFKRQLREAVAPIIKERAEMNEEQLKAADTQEENDFLKKQLDEQNESESTRQTAEQTNQEFLSELKTIQETHSISDTELETVAQELIDGYDGEITPQLIGQYYVERQAFSKAEGLLTELDGSLSKDDQIVENLVKLVKENPDFTDDEWKEIVTEAYGQPKKEMEQRVTKKVATTKQEVKQEEQKKYGSELDAFFFDELDD